MRNPKVLSHYTFRLRAWLFRFRKIGLLGAVMERNISPEEWASLARDGYLRLPGAFKNILPMLKSATSALAEEYPYGFSDPRYYTGTIAHPLTAETARADGRILIPYVGFRNFDILAPLANPYLHDLLERIVGKDFYFSNTWYQEVPPRRGSSGIPQRSARKY